MDFPTESSLLSAIGRLRAIRKRRIVNFSYAVFANMIRQRRNHRLPQWHYFLDNIYCSLPFQGFLPPLTVDKGKE